MTAPVVVAPGDGAPPPPTHESPAPLPLPPRAARAVLLLAVFVCAACGLVYELSLLTLGSHLVGDSVRQTSVVLGVVVCAMGLGSLAAKPLQPYAARSFALVELALSLVGGLSTLALYAAYAWLDLYTPALIATAVVVGGLIGAEVPLLMTLLQRIRAQDAGSAVADLNAADYVGALVGGLAFPFLLLPAFGQVRGVLVVGAVNLLAAALVSGWLLRRALPGRAQAALGAAGLAALVVLGLAALGTARFEIAARQALYDDPVVHAETSEYQDVVLTRSAPWWPQDDIRLFLNGDLQFSSVDEYRYHESLVHPALADRPRSVLVLGGGDGLALREVLRSPGVERVVEVELDPAVLRLAREDPELRRLNGGSLDDPRVEVVVADAMAWLRTASERFDAVVVDMPDPDAPPTAKLYSVEFYGLVARLLAPEGRLVVQAGSPYFAPDAFWCVETTLREAGWATTPYHVDVPSFGDWGFVLATRDAPPDLRLDPLVAPSLRFLDPAVLASAAVFPPDRGPRDVEPSTLDRPRILEYERRGWQGY